MEAPAARTWHREYIHRVDYDTRVPSVQLTSAPMIHQTLLPADAMFTPDSRRVVYSRRQVPDMPRELWLADLLTYDLRRLTDEPDVRAPAVAPDGTCLYYISRTDRVALRRLDLQTFERETVLVTDLIGEVSEGGSVRHDSGAYVVGGRSGPQTWALMRCDLSRREAEIIYESDALYDPRPQYSPAMCGDILFQENHGCLLDDSSYPALVPTGYGTDLHVISDDGSSLRDVSLGRSDVEMVRGHHCWAGDSGRVLTSLLRRETPDRAFAADQLVAATPGGQSREVVGRGPAFAHAAVTLDGQWWVAEESNSADLFVGSLNTRRQTLLLHTGASYGSPDYTRPRPMFTPGGRSVVYGSDATGIPQLHVAQIEDEVLFKLMR